MKETSKIESSVPGLGSFTTVDFHHEIEQFLYREAALLDNRDWEGWEELFCEGGVYWVPLIHGQQDPFNHASLFYEDAVMREVRRRRLNHARAWSQAPVTRTARTVGNVMVTGGSRLEGELTIRSTFQFVEWRSRRDQRLLAGHYTHSLVLVDEDWRIKQKRVDLINCDAVHSSLEVFV